jgi:hypothetical protein
VSWTIGLTPKSRAESVRVLFRAECNAFGKGNLAAIDRIDLSKYRRGAAFNRRHPFVNVLLFDIIESGEVIDLSKLERETEATRVSV